MIARGQQLLMADADGATRTSDLAKLEAALQQLNDPGLLLSTATKWFWTVVKAPSLGLCAKAP